MKSTSMVRIRSSCFTTLILYQFMVTNAFRTEKDLQNLSNVTRAGKGSKPFFNFNQLRQLSTNFYLCIFSFFIVLSCAVSKSPMFCTSVSIKKDY